MNHRPILNQRHYLILTAAFLLFVIYGSFVPLQYRSVDLESAHAKFIRRMSRGINFDMRSDWAANVLLFIPLGYLCMGSFAVDRKRLWPALPLIPLFAILSGLIEYLQIWFPPRDTNLNDIVAETLGGGIGVLGWVLMGQPVTDRIRQFMSSFGPGDWAVRMLPAYLLFLLCTEGMPFDLTISPGNVLHKIKRKLDETEIQAGMAMASIVPPMSRIPEKTLMTIAYFVPVGVLLANLPGARWRQISAVGRVLTAGFAVASAIEFVQLIVVSCSAYVTDVPWGTLCVVAGWRVAIIDHPLPRAFWWAAMCCWAFALILVSWLPFEGLTFALQSADDRLVLLPFREYIDANYVNGINKILHRTMAYVPFGFFSGRAFRARMSAYFFTGVGLGLLVEAGQLFLTTHQAGISDVILGGLGSGCGAIVAKRMAKIPSESHVRSQIRDVPPKRLL